VRGPAFAGPRTSEEPVSQTAPVIVLGAVPFGYLITTGLMATWTLFALAPPRPRHARPSNLSYCLGLLVNELPFVAFYWSSALRS
jgi:hypothetical protein